MVDWRSVLVPGKRVVFTLVACGVVFHLGAFALTVAGLQTGYLYELNPVMAYMFGLGLLPAFLLSLLVYLVLVKFAWHKPYLVSGLAPALAFGFDFLNDLYWMASV